MSKRGIIVFVIVVVILTTVSTVYMRVQQDMYYENLERIAVAELNGMIGNASGNLISGGNISVDEVRRIVNDVEDNNIEGLVIRLNSGGGAVATSQEIYNLIKGLEVPIVVSMKDTVASGGYYIAIAADNIMAQKGTLTGSIGVISTFVNPEGFYEKLGIEVETITSGEHKDMTQREMTEEERKKMQRISDDIYNQFIEDIVAERDLSEEDVRELATGELFVGSMAREKGLIDDIGGLECSIDKVSSKANVEDPIIINLEEDEGLLNIILGLVKNVDFLMEGKENIILEYMKDGNEIEFEYR